MRDGACLDDFKQEGVSKEQINKLAEERMELAKQELLDGSTPPAGAKVGSRFMVIYDPPGFLAQAYWRASNPDKGMFHTIFFDAEFNRIPKDKDGSPISPFMAT